MSVGCCRPQLVCSACSTLFQQWTGEKPRKSLLCNAHTWLAVLLPLQLCCDSDRASVIIRRRRQQRRQDQWQVLHLLAGLTVSMLLCRHQYHHFLCAAALPVPWGTASLLHPMQIRTNYIT